MPGIRLHHPQYRAAEGTTINYVVETPQEYPVPYNCPACGVQHDRKAIHLRLDSNGDVIVSQQVYEALLTVPTMAGLVLENEVSNPPDLFIGAVDRDKERIISAPLNAAAKAADKINPASTKYENRDRMSLIVPKEGNE